MAARAALAAALLAAVASSARGQSSPRADATALRWTYTRGRGAESCPDANALRQAIRAQLGRDPFTGDKRDDSSRGEGDASDGDASGDGDEQAIAIDVRRARGQLAARIELRDGSGALLGARELRGADCAELVPVITLAAAMAIDALARTRPAAAESEAQAVQQALDDEIPTISVAPPPQRPWNGTLWRASAGLLAAVDATTVAAFGLSVQVDYVRPHFSVGAELRGDLPTTASAFNTSVTASLWSASLVPCLRHKIASLCALIGLGNERVAAPDVGLSLSDLWAGFGLRVALDLPLYRVLGVRLHADVVAPVTRGRLGTLYETPPVSSSFGLAAVASFL
jgi:hypothetical protein